MNKHLPEEIIIDYALGNSSFEQRRAVRKHIAHCHSCKRLLNEWEGILHNHTNQQASPALKERIWRSIEKNRNSKKMKGKRKYVVGLYSAAVIFLMLFGMLIHEQKHTRTYEVALNDEIVKENILTNPQTEQIELIPVSDFQDISGNLWLNQPQQELLLEVDGLPSLFNQDYQLWIIYDNDEVKGELLVPKNGTSRVFIRGTDVNQFKVIKASVEPIGGSTVPTGPETFFIPLKN